MDVAWQWIALSSLNGILNVKPVERHPPPHVPAHQSVRRGAAGRRHTPQAARQIAQALAPGGLCLIAATPHPVYCPASAALPHFARHGLELVTEVAVTDDALAAIGQAGARRWTHCLPLGSTMPLPPCARNTWGQNQRLVCGHCTPICAHSSNCVRTPHLQIFLYT